jgi:uncharacterized membrane protein HdeD (DUF308 family)
MLSFFSYDWRVLLTRGILAITFGIIALVWPYLSLIILMVLFASYIFIDGVVSLMAGFRSRGTYQRWWLYVVEGAAGVLVALLTLLWPRITAHVFLVLVALWALATGGLEIAAGLQTRQVTGRVVKGRGSLLALGIVSMVLGVLLLAFPSGRVVVLVWRLGIYALLFGFVYCLWAYRIKRAKP